MLFSLVSDYEREGIYIKIINRVPYYDRVSGLWGREITFLESGIVTENIAMLLTLPESLFLLGLPLPSLEASEKQDCHSLLKHNLMEESRRHSITNC